MALFDSDFLKKLEYLSLMSRRVFRGRLLAQRRTRQMGGGIEFADHREYALGDDLRYLDWNVFARLGDQLIKRFEEEEDLHVYFLLDCSKSMEFGEPSKFDFARQITAALAYIALADLDRISVVAVAGGIEQTFPLTRGKRCILSLLRFLENLETTGTTTDLQAAVKAIVHRNRRTGLAVVVSDLYDRAGFQRGVNLLRHRGYELHLIHVFDPEEANPKVLGDVELVDSEDGETRTVTVTEKALRRYQAVWREFQDEIVKYCLAYGLSCTKASTEIPYDELVVRMMRETGAVA